MVLVTCKESQSSSPRIFHKKKATKGGIKQSHFHLLQAGGWRTVGVLEIDRRPALSEIPSGKREGAILLESGVTRRDRQIETMRPVGFFLTRCRKVPGSN